MSNKQYFDCLKGWSGGNASKKANDDGWDDEPSTTNKSNGKRLSDWNDERPNKFSRSNGKLNKMGAHFICLNYAHVY